MSLLFFLRQHAVSGLSDISDELRADGAERGPPQARNVLSILILFDLDHEDAGESDSVMQNIVNERMR